MLADRPQAPSWELDDVTLTQFVCRLSPPEAPSLRPKAEFPRVDEDAASE